MPMVDESKHDRNPKPITSKSVFIAEPETITPGLSPYLDPVDTDHPQLSSSPKQYRTNSSRRLSGRPERNSPSLQSISSLASLKSIPTIDPPGAEPNDKATSTSSHHDGPKRDGVSHIISQVAEWLEQEKTKRFARKSRKSSAHAKLAYAAEATNALADHFRSEAVKYDKRRHARRGSDLSDNGLALEKLEQILSESMHIKDSQKTPAGEKHDSYFPHRKSLRRDSSKKLMRRNSTVLSSDSEHPDNELLVPSAEVILDNSKTLRFSGMAAIAEVDASKRAAKEESAWMQFKREIVTLTHTLRVSGWRRVPIDRSEEIDVERLSGALTNAVYVVSPPKNLPQTPAILQVDAPSVFPRKEPPKLLLRIYGPQVEHLIDRESELQILRRLARRKIGPRLLGTFTNGRFEQFFYAKTLTAADLRIPETSKQIAKRMRELHDGIDLLKGEREGGPFIWKNWDKWVDRCEEITRWLDHQVLASTTQRGQPNAHSSNWKKRGLICGVEWSIFRRTVDTYRAWLLSQYDGEYPHPAISKCLVFAHNDTQYGNLLRLEPSGESPLLLPANEHKQLIVIDFEYASANPQGLEFANHFTEWCYNYHSPAACYALNEKAYPTPEEQYRFLKAYVQHHSPPRQPADKSRNRSNSAVLSPAAPTNSTGGSISSFMLDSRAPPTPGGYQEEERQREEALQHEIERLKRETRLWRVANSAQWVAWGIVQAKVPGMDDALEAKRNVTPRSVESGAAVGPEKRDPGGQIPGGGGKEDGSSHIIGSDPLSPEMRPLAEAARNKRPEERDVLTSPTAEAEPHEEEAPESEEDEFDYLGYAQQRALFFWGDVLQLGLVRKEELPMELLERVKIVEY